MVPVRVILLRPPFLFDDPPAVGTGLVGDSAWDVDNGNLFVDAVVLEVLFRVEVSLRPLTRGRVGA